MDCRVISAFTRGFNALCPARTTFNTSRLRQLGVDVSAVDDDVLDEHARLDLVALEERGAHVAPETAPFHRVPLDRHGEISLLHRPHPRRHPVHPGPPRLPLALATPHRL